MEKSRNEFTQEFMEKAVKLITEKGYQMSETPSNLRIHTNFLVRQKKVESD